MKILHIETRRHLSGGAKQVITLMRSLADLGLESELLCADDGVVAEFADEYDFKTYRVDYRGAHDIRLAKKIKEVVKQSRCDLVHAHSGRGAADHAALFARTHDIPTILTQRTVRAEHRLISRLKYRSYDKIAAVSQSVESGLLRQRTPRQKIELIYDGVNLADYAEPYARSELREALGIPYDARIIGNVGRFNQKKGQLDLLETFIELSAQYPDLHLLLFGNGEMLDELLDFIDNNGLTGRAHIAGFKSDLPKWYASLDLLVHTAIQDALSVVIMEAMANAVPVVAYNRDGVNEIIQHAKTGLLVQPGEKDQLEDAISRVLADQSMYKRMSKEARTVCRREFNSDRMSRQYAEIYSSLVEG